MRTHRDVNAQAALVRAELERMDPETLRVAMLVAARVSGLTHGRQLAVARYVQLRFGAQ